MRPPITPSTTTPIGDRQAKPSGPCAWSSRYGGRAGGIYARCRKTAVRQFVSDYEIAPAEVVRS